MSIYDVYGLRTENLEDARALIEKILGLQLDLHESSYKGGEYYMKGLTGQENYQLQRNYCDDEGWTEEEYKDFGTVLYVNRSPRANLLRDSFLSELKDKVVFIKRETITEDRWSRVYHYISNKDELVSEQKLP